MLKSTLASLMLPLLLLLSNSPDNSAAPPKQKNPEKNPSPQTETVEKLIVASGNVALELDLDRLNGTALAAKEAKPETLRFAVAPDSYFAIIATSNGLRGPLPGTMALIPQNTATLPAPLSASLQQLVLEKMPSDAVSDLAVRDGKTGFVFFNIEGHHYDYEAGARSLTVKEGRLLISEEFARQLGRPLDARTIVGTISIAANMRPIEVRTLVNGAVQSAVLPPMRNRTDPGAPDAVTAVSGPDVIVGDLPAVQQATDLTAVPGFVGLGVGTTSCNNGDQPFNWFANPNNDHPVIPQNLYRMSASADRFEQIGQSWLKHAFTALEENACGFGCNTSGCTTGTHLCVGCSDPYSASLNYGTTGLGSRAWVNPFTGFYPRGDSATPANNHTGHTHNQISHRVAVAVSDLSTATNPGATYFAEGQYVTPHEYAWCQSTHGAACNQYNNVSYRQFTVTGTTSFSFGAVGSTVRMQPAIKAWTGATVTQFEPDPGNDGIGFIGSKVTGPVSGVYHYEYAAYNENLDRAIQSFSVPLGPGVTVSNIGFRAPRQEPAFANDGTVGSAGFSGTAWTSAQTATDLTWSSETFTVNQNANAIRWGTLYNFRFDSTSPPQSGNGTVGFFKTGSPVNVVMQIPTGNPTPTPTASPTPTPTPTPSPSPAPTASPTPSPTPTPAPTATPTPTPESVFLPIGTIDTSVGTGTTVSQPVTVTNIDPARHYIALSFDLTFNETVVSFTGTGGVTIAPQAAGLTDATEDAAAWSFSANVLAGAGPIRTLRVFANQPDGDTPIQGSGLLFNLRMRRVSSTPGAVSPLIWVAPPNNFQFFTPSGVNVPTQVNGSITIQGSTNSIAGTVTYCTHPTLPPIPGVTMTLSGTSGGVLPTDGSGNYSFTGLTSGGNYTVVPSKAALAPGVDGIDGSDLVKVLQHALLLVPIPPGCALTAADADNQAAGVDGSDIVAILRFYLGFPNAPNSRAGQYLFTPVNRAYSPLVSDQIAQNYSALIYGDVTGSAVDNIGWVHRADGGPTQDAAGAGEMASTVAAVALPNVMADPAKGDFIAAVTTTAIEAKNNLVAFQGNITFDERVVSFDENRPVQAAGLTASNWNVVGHVLPGAGPIRTLRVLGYASDLTPLSGKGTLFELRMTQVKPGESTQLAWAPDAQGLRFIDGDSRMQPPGNAAPGSVSSRPSQR